MREEIDIIQLADLPKIYHRGPALGLGQLPAVFYFSLSGKESLSLHPYNQPAVFLSQNGIRVFSITLPGHEGGLPHKHAMKEWSESFSLGKNLANEFAEICLRALDGLIAKNYIHPGRIGTAGLSRGAYIATFLASKDDRINSVLGFAPLTRLETLKDFQHIPLQGYLQPFNLDHLIPLLIDKSIRYYIGNLDTLVGTPHCFSFIHSLAEKAYQEKHRFPSVELVIYPSVGHKGHGTPPEIFQAGSAWLASIL